MMMNNTLARKVVAVVTVAVMLVISSRAAWATAGVRGGALSVLGTVEVDGERAISGGTFFSGSAISTREESEATINLGGSGLVALSANSALRLSFTDKGLKGWLEAGEARVSIQTGVSVSLVFPGGVVLVDGSQSTTFTVATRNDETEVAVTRGSVEKTTGAGRRLITAGEDVLAGVPQNQHAGWNGSALAALLVAIGGAVAATIWVATHESEPHQEDMTFGGTVSIGSDPK